MEVNMAGLNCALYNLGVDIEEGDAIRYMEIYYILLIASYSVVPICVIDCAIRVR